MTDSTKTLDQADDTGLVIGAHVVTQRRWYTHHGIYAGNGKVIHYAGLSRSLRRAPVEEVSCDEFAGGHAIWVERTPDARYGGADAVRRANQRLGEDRYRLMTNNCEHFCAWCLYGESRSGQIERLTSLARRGREFVAKALLHAGTKAFLAGTTRLAVRV
ncbi:lecithin retinol acyltransferase family protein [Paraburkholderia sp. BR13444]|uniref:lecithin retinol acyltransferase family protein n=1 Tax=Paraburkholderia TaxID=1822464 RepID=UPI0034CD6362